MLTGLRRILSPRFVRRSLRRAMRRPFGRLVSHFLMRLVRGGRDGAEGFELTLGPLLGLLAAPGAVSCFVLLQKYSSLRNWLMGIRHVDVYAISLPEKHMYIAIAMAVCGIVTVLRWDRILPDSQDYLNLAPLPVGTREVFAANAMAILIAVAVLAIDVNAIPTLLFPAFVAASGHLASGPFLEFIGTHILIVTMASVFSVFAVFGVMGTLAAVLPREVFRSISGTVRGALLLVLLIVLASGVGGSAPEWSPARWFLGLYQSMQHRAGPSLGAAARWAWPSLGIAVALSVVSYTVSYRRRFAAVLETGRSMQAKPGLGLAVLDLFAGRSPGFERACHRFTVRALLRSETHRMTIGVSVAIGWLLAAQTGDPLRQGPLVAGYLLLLGLRAAFDMPAAASASWIFRTILDEKENEAPAVARRVMAGFLTPLVLAPALAAGWWAWGPAAAVLHTFYVAALCGVLMEVFLVNYRKLPLACPMPGFRHNFLVVFLIHVCGVAFFNIMGARLERWMSAAPERFLLVPVALAGLWIWNRRRIAEARAEGELEEGLVFESALPAVVQRMNLSDGA